MLPKELGKRYQTRHFLSSSCGHLEDKLFSKEPQQLALEKLSSMSLFEEVTPNGLVNRKTLSMYLVR
jgi:hypothetical protein